MPLFKHNLEGGEMGKAYTKQDILDGRCTAEGKPIKAGSKVEEPKEEVETPAETTTQPEAPAETAKDEPKKEGE